MKRTSKVMTSIVVLGVAVATTASARGIPAFAGTVAEWDDASCPKIDYTSGWVKNECAAAIDFEIPLHTDSNGLKSVDLALQAPDTTTSCQAVARSRTGTDFTTSGWKWPTVFNTPTSLILTRTSPQGPVVGSKYLLWVDCILGPQASLIQADWNN